MASVEPAGVLAGARVRGATRVADRRAGVSSMLAALAAQVQAGCDQVALRAEFEARLRQALRLKSVRLREESAIYGSLEAAADAASERVCLEVPTRASWPRMQLEARCGPTTVLDAWGFQLMEMAAHIAALLVDVDRRGPGAARASAGSILDEPRPLVGTSELMCRLRQQIERVAATDFIVLVEGESGTGKELVARQIHGLSRRRLGPFVAVNCAAIVETLLEAELFGIEERTATGVRGRRGKFELADGGTLFLDEVADLAPAAQAKLLRAIQELSIERVGGHVSHHVNTRIIVATNRSLRALVTRGAFREDLFYRLSGVELHVPPLRARRGDIVHLVAHFLARSQPRMMRLTTEAAQALGAYEWPGNVRELERALEGAITSTRTDLIGLDDLPDTVRGPFGVVVWPSLSRNETLRAWGCRYAKLVLERCGGNKRRACDVLGISYHTLQCYLREEMTESEENRSGGDSRTVGDAESVGDAGAIADSEPVDDTGPSVN
jgi:DNA-binding NtrC family response regulator